MGIYVNFGHIQYSGKLYSSSHTGPRNEMHLSLPPHSSFIKHSCHGLWMFPDLLCLDRMLLFWQVLCFHLTLFENSRSRFLCRPLKPPRPRATARRMSMLSRSARAVSGGSVKECRRVTRLPSRRIVGYTVYLTLTLTYARRGTSAFDHMRQKDIS